MDSYPQSSLPGLFPQTVPHFCQLRVVAHGLPVYSCLRAQRMPMVSYLAAGQSAHSLNYTVSIGMDDRVWVQFAVPDIYFGK